MIAPTSTAGLYAKPKRRLGAYLLILGALVAFCLTTYRYVTPLSGVNDTGGALLTASSELILLLTGLILAFSQGHGGRRASLILAWIIVILAFIAELFLHGWISAVFLAVAAVGIVIQTFTGISGRSA